MPFAFGGRQKIDIILSSLFIENAFSSSVDSLSLPDASLPFATAGADAGVCADAGVGAGPAVCFGFGVLAAAGST